MKLRQQRHRMNIQLLLTTFDTCNPLKNISIQCGTIGFSFDFMSSSDFYASHAIRQSLHCSCSKSTVGVAAPLFRHPPPPPLPKRTWNGPRMTRRDSDAEKMKWFPRFDQLQKNKSNLEPWSPRCRLKISTVDAEFQNQTSSSIARWQMALARCRLSCHKYQDPRRGSIGNIFSEVRESHMCLYPKQSPHKYERYSCVMLTFTGQRAAFILKLTFQICRRYTHYRV